MSIHKLMDILSQLQDGIKTHKLLSQQNKDKFLHKLEKARKDYSSLDDPEFYKELIDSLVNRGNDLLNEVKRNKNPKELTQKTAFYLRYLQASTYDVKGDISGINQYTRLFLVTAALFMALTPQFYGFVLPVIFVVPIYAGLKGVKRRNSTGFLMTLTVVPMALMSSITWVRYIFQVALPDFSQTVATTAQAWNVSPFAAQLLLIIPGILSIVLIIASLATAYLGYKYRDMFV